MGYAMAKPSDFYVSALDFFGTILPGAVTVGAAVVLDVPGHLPTAVKHAFALDASKVGAFVVVAYVVGQVSNSVGSLLLDAVYDLLYAPGDGWLSKAHEPRAGARRDRLSKELEGLVSGRNGIEHGRKTGDKAETSKGVYQTVRAYLKIRSPETFADIEKLEGEQKFFRALTVGVLALALCLPPGDVKVDSWSVVGLVGLLVLLFVRYVSIRRKTIERAYTYFSLRQSFQSAAKGGAEESESA
jgi:hypothetical protein